MGRGLLLTLLVSSVLWESCDTPPLDLPEIYYEGEHIRFGTTAPIPPCEGTLRTLDTHIAELIRALDMPLPPGKKIHIYWMRDAMERTPCAPNMDGCASVRNGEMLAFVAQLEAAEHESVHLLLWPFGIGHKLLVEGTAECFGGLHHQEPIRWPHDGGDLLSLVDSPIDNTEAYRRAGTYVCFLADRYGVEPLRRILFQSRPSWTLSDFNKGFAAVFHATFEETAAAFSTDQSGCTPIPLRCDLPWIPVDSTGGGRDDFPLACNDATTEGGAFFPVEGAPKMEQARLFRSRLVQIDTPGYYRICISDSRFPDCDPMPQNLGEPALPEWASTRYSPTNRSFEDPLRAHISDAQCRVGPGCPDARTRRLHVGFDNLLYLESGTQRITAGFADESDRILEQAETVNIRLSACAGENRHIPEECVQDTPLACGPEQCRVCDTLVEGVPLSANPEAAPEAPVCFHCRCLP